jgi:general secretion pathway protein A
MYGTRRVATADLQASSVRARIIASHWSKLDRPVVLTLTDSTGETHHAVLTVVDGEFAELSLGATSVTAGVDELGEYWYGQYLLLWRPPNGDPSVLARGAQSPKVQWLRQSLAALDPDGKLRPGDSDLFDGELEQQLLEFQRRNRLDTDGLAGQQTQIIINSQLGLDGRPRLSGT